MKLYREYAPKKFARYGAMYSLEALESFIPKYQSLYAFSQEDATIIKSSRSSRGFDRFTPWADKLTIDIDDSRENLKHNVNVLVKAGYGVRLYKSGGVESFHIEVDHLEGWVGDQRLPYSHRQLVESLGLRCDTCIYQPGRIFRMEGMVHEKTGNIKTLFKTIPGNKIEVPLVEKPEKFWMVREYQPEQLPDLLMDVACRSVTQPEPGERHMMLWGIACDLFQVGLGYSAVLEFCDAINKTWEHAHDYEAIVNAVRGAAIKEGVPHD